MYKKAISLLLAAIMMLGSSVCVFAETSAPSAAGNETTIIDAPDKPDTGIADTEPTKPETSVIDPEETTEAGGVDLSDIDYTPIDLTGYEKWDGKTKMEEGKNYYIEGAVKPKKTYTVPAGSKLVITPGSSLTVYKGKTFKVKGSVIAEPKSTVTISGTVTFGKGSTFENYGTLKGTLSSAVNIMGEYIVRKNSLASYSGVVNVYKTGIYLNYGQTTLTSNSKMTVTGDFQSAEGGKLLNKGYLAVTVSGRASFAGYYYLYGETVNSGVFIFEKTVRYYKSRSARFAVSKSSRLIDYRYDRPSNNIDADNGTDKEDPPEKPTDTGIKGIDVSYAQGTIDWAAVKDAGIKFAMIRASRGDISSTRPMAEDRTFRYNIENATANGIDVGVYHYLYASTVKEAVQEAKFFIEAIKPYDITYPVVLDVEEQYQADLGKKKLTKICKAFLDEIKKAGYYGMIYANKSWLTNHLDMDELEGTEVWLAQWNTVPTYKGEFGMWQYSSKGIVSGIDGYVDLNLSYKDYAKIIREGGYNKKG